MKKPRVMRGFLFLLPNLSTAPDPLHNPNLNLGSIPPPYPLSDHCCTRRRRDVAPASLVIGNWSFFGLNYFDSPEAMMVIRHWSFPIARILSLNSSLPLTPSLLKIFPTSPPNPSSPSPRIFCFQEH
jgi:hypothetical protein